MKYILFLFFLLLVSLPLAAKNQFIKDVVIYVDGENTHFDCIESTEIESIKSDSDLAIFLLNIAGRLRDKYGYILERSRLDKDQNLVLDLSRSIDWYSGIKALAWSQPAKNSFPQVHSLKLGIQGGTSHIFSLPIWVNMNASNQQDYFTATDQNGDAYKTKYTQNRVSSDILYLANQSVSNAANFALGWHANYQRASEESDFSAIHEVREFGPIAALIFKVPYFKARLLREVAIFSSDSFEMAPDWTTRLELQLGAKTKSLNVFVDPGFHTFFRYIRYLSPLDIYPISLLGYFDTTFATGALLYVTPILQVLGQNSATQDPVRHVDFSLRESLTLSKNNLIEFELGGVRSFGTSSLYADQIFPRAGLFYRCSSRYFISDIGFLVGFKGLYGASDADLSSGPVGF